VVLKPKTAFVHHYKREKSHQMRLDEKPRRPRGFYPVFTAQLYFCSPECVTLRALSGIYSEN